MALLSKKERQTLTPDEKRALRKERRGVRREERGPLLGIKWEKLEPIAEGLILEIAGDLLPGEEKMQEVIDELAERADEFLSWEGLPVFIAVALEAVDGVIIKAIARGTLRPMVQKVYEKLKAEGKLGGEDGEE
tara:strand:- start:1695 stop:2096 length:402 start_codon:yes stop_codon:yes gene_type:complete